MKNKTWKRIRLRSKTLKAIREEFLSYPSLGLVSKINSGSHQDMTIQDFKRSYQIFPGLLRELEKKTKPERPTQFADLRELGKKYERLMFQKTRGINTHKGLIFSLIIFYWALLKNFSFKTICQEISQLCQPLLADFNQSNSVGLKLYHTQKFQGARHTALSGFQVVFSAYDFYQKFLKRQNLKTNEIIFSLLIFLTINLEDTTLINKVGSEKWKEIKAEYQLLLDKIKVDYHNQLFFIEKTNSQAIKENISPGGAADLVVLTLILIKIKY